ncbi:hypothetical protein BT96DRAFT_995165 [Gymnopus androsaceus JB14]|uniref:Uncharacterized protein n=1 Tax=Gymnopus androsaceus JB14 TaxID=1447944 RepID=A0A6A4HJ68_9AGAR|nr:hypothetical protein BT96DRAFT_995165 [Gymnopus androsaceus JB14]
MASQPSQYTYPSISPPAVDLTTQHTMNSNNLPGGNQYDNQPQQSPLNSAIAYDNIFDQYLDSSALYGSNNDQQYQPEDTFERFLRDFPMSSQQDDDQVPWNGQMSSLQPPEALQPNILELSNHRPEAQQPQLPISCTFSRLKDKGELTGGTDRWTCRLNLLTDRPPTRPRWVMSRRPFSSSEFICSASSLRLRSYFRATGAELISPSSANSEERQKRIDEVAVRVAASSMPPPPAPSAPRNGSELPSIGSKKGKARAVPKRSQAVASSSSMPPPPVPDRPNKRGREVENGGEPMPTKRAMKTAPVESSDSLRRFDPFCQKLLGVECNCRDCFKAVGTAHFYYVQSLHILLPPT